MKRSRYEEYCDRLFVLQQRVPNRVAGEYEAALTALVNARYHDATRHFGWLRSAERQLRIAAKALAEIDGISTSQGMPPRQVVRVVIRRLFIAVAGAALMTSGFLLGLQHSPAPPPRAPSIGAVHGASNTNATNTNVSVGDDSVCDTATYCGDASNHNNQNAFTGAVTVTTNNP